MRIVQSILLTRSAILSNRSMNAEQTADHCNAHKSLICAKLQSVLLVKCFRVGNFVFKAFSLPFRLLFVLDEEIHLFVETDQFIRNYKHCYSAATAVVVESSGAFHVVG